MYFIDLFFSFLCMMYYCLTGKQQQQQTLWTNMLNGATFQEILLPNAAQ